MDSRFITVALAAGQELRMVYGPKPLSPVPPGEPMEIFEIAPNLYQSAKLTDNSWRAKGIAAIVDLEGGFDAFGDIQFTEHELYFYWPIHDDPRIPDERILRQLARLINALRAANLKVLVHCKGGLNRSGLVNACALVAEGQAPQAAIDQIRARRGPNALNNQTFVSWLLRERPGT